MRVELAEQLTPEHHRLLLELSQLISERRGVDEIFEVFADRVREGVTFEFSSLFVSTSDPGFVRAVAHYPQLDSWVADGTIHAVADVGMDRVESGMEYVPRKVGISATAMLAERGYERAWVSPLVVDGVNYGMLTVAKTAPGPFPRAEIEVLHASAGLLARAVRQDLELESARRQAARAQVASDLTIALQASESLETIFQRLPPLLAEALDVDYVGLVLERHGLFQMEAEAPAGLHPDAQASEEGTRFILDLASRGPVLEFRATAEATPALHAEGYRRIALAFLSDGARPKGALSLARRARRPFDAEERRFVEVLRSILSQALVNRDRIRRTEVAAARARTLNEVALLLNANERTDAIFQRLTDLLSGALEVDYVALMEASEVPDQLRIVGSAPELPGVTGLHVPAAFVGADDMLAANQQLFSYATEDYAGDVDAVRRIHELGMRSGINVLLRHDGRANGLLALGRRSLQPFTDEECSFLETLGALLSQAISSRQRLDAAEAEAVRLKLLNGLGVLLNNGESLEAFFQILAAELSAVVPFDGIVLLVAADRPGTFRVVRSLRGQALTSDQLLREEDFGEAALAEFARGAKVVEGNMAELSSRLTDSARGTGTRRGAILPLRHGAETVGYILLGRLRNQAFGVDQLPILELVGTIVGQAIANLKKVEDKEAEAARSGVLSELAVLLKDGGPVQAHFERLSQLVLKAIGYDFLSIRLVDPETGAIATVRSQELPGLPPDFANDGVATRIIEREYGGVSQYRTANVDRPVPRAMRAAGFERAVTAMIPDRDGRHGLITIGRRENRPFSAEDENFVGLLGSLLGRAAESHREAYERTAEGLRNRVLSELALLVNDGEPLNAHFERLRAILFQGVGFDFLALSVVQPGTTSFRTMRSHPLVEEDGSEFVLERAAIDRVAAAVGSSWQYGPDGVRLGAPSSLFRSGIERAASFILRAGEGIEGLLTIGRSSPRDFTPQEMTFFEIVGTLLANASANERRLVASTSEAEDQATLADAARAVASETSVLAIVRGLRGAVGRFIPSPFVNFGYLVDGRVHFHTRDGGVEQQAVGPYFAQALREGQAVVPAAGNRPTEGSNVNHAAAVGIEGHVVTSASSGGVPIGLLVIGSRDHSFVPSERTLRLCRLIADIVGPAMESARAARRALEDAEEQRFLADIAAGAARAPDDQALLFGLREPFLRFIPRAHVLFCYLDGDRLYLPQADVVYWEIGVQAREALEHGQAVGTIDSPAVFEPTRAYFQSIGVETWCASRASSSGENLGILLLGSREPGFRFNERALNLCRLAADIIGPALANLRESARRKEEAEDQRLLAEAASAAAGATDELELLRGLAGPMGRLVPAARLGMFLLDEDGRARVIGGPAEAVALGPQALRTLEEGQVVGTPDDPDLTEMARNYAREQGIQHYIDTTLKSGADSIGFFFVGSRDPAFRVSGRELRLCKSVADIIAPALASLREGRRRKEDAEEQRILAEAAAALAAGNSEADLLARLARVVRRFIPRGLVSFSYFEGDEMFLFDGRNRRPIHSHIREALRTGQAAGHLDTTEMTGPSRDLITAYGMRHWVDTISHSAGTAVGSLFVGSPEEEVTFTPRVLRLLRFIADFTGPAMVNAHEEARRSREAEDERILSEVAAMAARAGDTAGLLAALGPALAPVVPAALTLYGFFQGKDVVYRITDETLIERFGSGEVRLPLTDVGRAARETGQAAGSLANVPASWAYQHLGLQAYALTSYNSVGAAPGVLLCSTTDPDFRFDDRALALLRRVVQVIGPAVESSRAAAERARQAELYGLILRSLSEGVILADADGRVVFANTLGRTILNAVDPSGTMQNWQDIVKVLPSEVQDGYRGVYQQNRGHRGRSTLEIDGATHWFDYEFVPLTDPTVKLLVVAADVTLDIERENEQARHRAQMEQSQRLAALGELIGGVAHELNNPLTAILGFAEVMSLSPAARPLSEELSIIQKEALRARNIVRDLLFIVRPGTSERTEVPVAELVAHIERLRKSAFLQQGIGWTTDIAEPCVVWGNENQLTQVILNLVTNAEHALQGAAQKHITIRARANGERTEISVTDTGVGMDEATRNRVFEPFFTTKQGHGTGLGLPLSYSIIQAHGGEFHVESVPGEGTTFTIHLPVHRPGDAAAQVSAPELKPGARRVLVIDDEPSLRKVCQRLIASMGHECFTAENTARALDLARANQFDLVLCDYRLASETASDVIAGFETVCPELIGRTVIATGATTDAGVVELTERFSLPLMAKPYGIEELTRIIERVA